MLNYEGEAVPPVPDVRRRVTVYRGQKTWDPNLTIEASSLRQAQALGRTKNDGLGPCLASFEGASPEPWGETRGLKRG